MWGGVFFVYKPYFLTLYHIYMYIFPNMNSSEWNIKFCDNNCKNVVVAAIILCKVYSTLFKFSKLLYIQYNIYFNTQNILFAEMELLLSMAVDQFYRQYLKTPSLILFVHFCTVTPLSHLLIGIRFACNLVYVDVLSHVCMYV